MLHAVPLTVRAEGPVDPRLLPPPYAPSLAGDGGEGVGRPDQPNGRDEFSGQPYILAAAEQEGAEKLRNKSLCGLHPGSGSLNGSKAVRMPRGIAKGAIPGKGKAWCRGGAARRMP